MKNKIIPYNPILKDYARQLRKNSTLSEVLLWQKIKNKGFGVQFHRQVPLLNFIVDFYCHELQLAIEVDGNSHDYNYDSDAKRQGLLERQGVQFIRFSDLDVKNNMFSVEIGLKEKIDELLKNRPEKASSERQSRTKSPLKFDATPLKSPQGDNSTPSSVRVNSDFSFPKKEKLKGKKLVELLFKERKSLSDFPLRLFYHKIDSPTDVKIKTGVAVPKKNFKSAVKRNRIKRLLRESYRLNKHLVFNNSEGSYAFLILYLGKEIPTYHKVEKSMQIVLQKFLKKIDDEKVD